MKHPGLFSVIALAVTLLHGCGGGSDSPSGVSSDPAPVAGGGSGSSGGGTSGGGGTGGGSSGDASNGGTPGTGTGGTTSPGSHRLTVQVSGLASPLTLRNVDGQSLTVTPGATSPTSATFANGYATGSTYRVSIASLPSNQNCVLSNPEGVVSTSDVVSVTVSCSNRSWTVGQVLESDDVTVSFAKGGIDRQGRVTAAFVKGAYTQPNSLYVTRGLPGAAGEQPQWSTPVRVDSAETEVWFSFLFSGRNFSLAVSPNGNAVIAWAADQPCTSTTFRQSGDCAHIYSATRAADAETWSAPVRVGDSPSGSGLEGAIEAHINDRGDVAIKYQGYDFGSPPVRRTSTDTYRAALALRPAGRATYETVLLRDYQYVDNVAVVLDRNGGLVAAAEHTQANSSNRDVTAYIGQVGSGFSAATATVVDQNPNSANLEALRVGSTGDVLLTWRQNDGSGTKVLAATKGLESATWSTPAVVTSVTGGVPTVTDAGDAVYYSRCNRYFLDRASNAWAAKVPVQPSNCSEATTAATVAGDGSYLNISGGSGLWITYNAADNTMSRAANVRESADSYLLGFAKNWGSSRIPLFTRTQSGNFIGALLAIEEYDTLPTPNATSGAGRRGINNLWGFFLK